MNSTFNTKEEIYDDLLKRYPVLEACRKDILAAFELIKELFEKKGCLYVAGNGGSAADSDHIVGELMKSFMAKRRLDDETASMLQSLYGEEGAELAKNLEAGFRAVALPSLVALSTAGLNDIGGEAVFAQMLAAIGLKDEIFLALSTSGNSKNIVKAAMVAKAKGMKVISLTGKNECKLDKFSDVIIHAPELETHKIQELHLPIYHGLCAMLESHFFA